MDLMEAIAKRISCRSYIPQPIDSQIFDALEEEIERINKESGLSFQLYGPLDGGPAIQMNRKMFAGEVYCYAALVAKDDELSKEKLGYYGEQLVLFATMLDLGTCWVAGTFDRESTRVELAEGEVLHDVIPIGYPTTKTPLKQRTIRSAIRGRDKDLPSMYQGPTRFKDAPEWIQVAIKAVHDGPSAVNEQPVVFTQESADAPVIATMPLVKSGLEYTDLGIAKLHFEIAAASMGVNGAWEWGEGAAFK